MKWKRGGGILYDKGEGLGVYRCVGLGCTSEPLKATDLNAIMQ